MIQPASSCTTAVPATRRHSSCGVASGSRKSANASTATAMTPSAAAAANRRPSAATAAAAAAAAAGLIVTSVRATGSTADKQHNSTQQATSSLAIERRRRRSDCCSTAVSDTTWFIRPIHIADSPTTGELGTADAFAADSRLLDATSAGVFGAGGKKLTESVEKELANGLSTLTTPHQRHHLHHSHMYHRQNKSDFKEVGADSSFPSSVQTKGSTSSSNGFDDLLKAYFPATLLASRLRDSLAIELPESGQLSEAVNGEPSLAPSPPTSLPQAADRLQRSSDLDERENVMATMSPGRKTTSVVALTGAVLENKNPSQSLADRRSSRRTRTPTTPSASAGRSSRPASCRSSSSSASNGSFDRLYLNSSTDTNGLPLTALMSSPYQNDAARSRLDVLRIEEKNLLEQKRQAELERIRGPQPKWYEMRSSDFHREARRNNELMKNRASWQRLLDYRHELEIASHQFHSGSEDFIVVDPPMTTSVRQSTLSTGAGVAGVSGNDARY